ncbi:Uncharacterised protein [Mycobacteroides abscessus subsp. abscessus]|nr:Uncharacterised protein [Mycobacteroides abscessus subsp. abscessus]
MPAIANNVSGKISVCVIPVRFNTRSGSLPGTLDACAAKESSPPPAPRPTALGTAATVLRCAITTKASPDATKMSPCKYSVGPSIATAPFMTT